MTGTRVGKRMKSRLRGFTLIELMITVAVMVILATVGYPLYTKQMQKSRRADAKVALQSIALAQEQYFTVTGGYTTTLSSLSLDASGIDTATGKTSKGYYDVAITEDANGIVLTATAGSDSKQFKDENCRSFILTELGDFSAKNKEGTVVDNCW